ncbi:MAG: ferrochelatase [Rothia sp. (in: high G+C Gram-positive bacteria)]|nr:ferrochelatase [Rothia sp. (in: high G+C Gram-positive bacteria)]
MPEPLPRNIIPNQTDPANTATNGPATLDETTIGTYTSERTLTRPRASAPQDYDLVILSSFGGPEGQEDVIPFLRNVTAGRGIPDERLEEVATHYRANGGVSPINAQNRALLTALRQAMAEKGPAVDITWANRNWAPYVNDVVKQAYDEGKRKILVLATSAYPGYSSCRQYREDYGLALAELGLEGKLQIDKIRPYWDTPGFITPFVEGLVQGLAEVRAQLAASQQQAAGEGKIRIMFCTHSIPTSAANEAGPGGVDYEGGSAYVEKHLEAARAVLAGVEAIDPTVLDGVDWELVYQSRSGPPSMPWLEPDVNDALEALQGAVDGVVLVPLGFVSDHMEVVWDLDTEALNTCKRLGLAARRTPTPGTHPAYVEGLRQLIAERVVSTAPAQDLEGVQAARQSLCGGPGWFDACDPDCCKPRRPGTDKPVIAEF